MVASATGVFLSLVPISLTFVQRTLPVIAIFPDRPGGLWNANFAQYDGFLISVALAGDVTTNPVVADIAKDNNMAVTRLINSPLLTVGNQRPRVVCLAVAGGALAERGMPDWSIVADITWQASRQARPCAAG